MLVIRLSKNNQLQMSKPCDNCTNCILTMPKQKGYKITKVYYSEPPLAGGFGA